MAPRYPLFRSCSFLAFALASQLAMAEIVLVDGGQNNNSGTFAAKLLMKPRAERTEPRKLYVPQEIAAATGDAAGWQVSNDPGPNMDVESALIATPTLTKFNRADWRVTAEVEAFTDGTSGDGADVSSAISLAWTEVGGVNALRLTVDPTQVVAADGSTLRPTGIRISLQGPVPPLPPGKTRTKDDPTSRLMSSLFINGDLIGSLPERSFGRKLNAVRTAVPGATRVSYKVGERLTKVPLTSLGLTVGTSDTLRLVYQGSEIPSGGITGSDIWFYTPRRNTLSDVTDSVFATSNSASPTGFMATRPAFSELAPTSTEVSLSRSKLFAPELLFVRNMVRAIGERFVWYQRNTNGTTTQSLALADDLTTNTISIDATIYGLNNSTVSPDHFTILSLNGVAKPEFSWEGRTPTTRSLTWTFPSIPASSTLTFAHQVRALSPFDGIGVDQQGLDSLLVRWQGRPRLDANGICRIDLPALTSGAPARLISVGGFAVGTPISDVIILDITNPLQPVQLLNPTIFTDSMGTLAVAFEVPAETTLLHVQQLSTAATPTTIATAETLPADLPGGTELKAVYIRPPGLAAELQRLVAIRSPGIIELDPQAAYNAFNGGQESPEAIRSALIEIIGQAPLRAALPEVLLVGHGSIDRRDYLGLLPPFVVPSFLELSISLATGSTVENPIDAYYGLLFGNDDLFDAQVARLPVKSVAQLKTIIDRQIAHDAVLPQMLAGSRPGLFVTDVDPEFQADVPRWQALWAQSLKPVVVVNMVTETPTSSGTPENTAIRNALQGPNAGIGFMMYMGHGNVSVWSSPRAFHTDDILGATSPSVVAQVQTAGKWPTVTTFTCLNSYYALPAGPISMCEAWLVAGGGHGAISTFAPCSFDYYTEQSLFAEQVLMQVVLPVALRPDSIGELLTVSANRYLTLYPSLAPTARVYLLFGDPRAAVPVATGAASSVKDWMWR